MNLKPNLIFIYADDLGRGMLSCYGQKHFETPNIDRIANEGLRFQNAYGCAYCAPSRASLITGNHDSHRGGWTFTQGGIYRRVAEGKLSIEDVSELIHTVSLNPTDDTTFLAQVPKQAGYVTAQIGKLEWGFSTTARELNRHGWDVHYGFYDHVDCHGFYPPYLFDNGMKVDISGNTRLDCGKAPENNDSPEAVEERWDRQGRGVYSQDLFDEKILDFLRQNSDRPFFLYHPSQLPHGPIITEAIDPKVKDHPDLSDYEKEYASMVLRLDQTVGLILDELKKLGIDDNTMVVFCSDNGHAPYYHEKERCNTHHNVMTGEAFDNVDRVYNSISGGDVFDGNDGMSGLKFSNWEGGVRLPFLVRWPGVVPAGAITERLMSNYDYFATLCDLLEVPLPKDKDSVSYLEVLKGQLGAVRGKPIVFASPHGPALVTDEGWKLKQITLPSENRYHLYQLPTDRLEHNNVVQEYPELAHELGRQLLFACDGNFINGTPAVHQCWFPGFNFHGPNCEWSMKP